MTVSRGWTWLDEAAHDEDTDDATIEAEIEALVRRWNALATDIENEGFRRQAAIEDYGYVPGEEDEDIGPSLAAGRRVDRTLKDAELQKIEEMLHERGARLMRPYEHYNEEEAYMQYMEQDRYYGED